MKSAHDWIVWKGKQKPFYCEHEFIKGIQKDALEGAERAVHQISRGTKSEDRAIALDDAEVAIISLSSTL